ncbi:MULTISPECIES: ferredoxin [unclassified Streptomyces]|uniref:ferredoxin n=1 Tax=Streptomyces sp. TN58 TaxID=234612 RepID=UPI000B1815EC|nr:ferredoxin [Streptomyces sp. TN58]
MSYWDPLPSVRAAESGPLPAPDGGTWRPAPEHRGGWWNPRPERWAERDWRNVPGPFYGAGTDNCWTGRLIAPAHVLYDDEWGAEFVYRQPRDPAQALALLGAAAQDPMGGYACDGDDHWTAELVGDWWRERGRVREWAAALHRRWSVSDGAGEREAAGGAREYVAYIDEGLAQDLRHYLFWLSEGRPAGPGEPLPALSPREARRRG